VANSFLFAQQQATQTLYSNGYNVTSRNFSDLRLLEFPGPRAPAEGPAFVSAIRRSAAAHHVGETAQLPGDAGTGLFFHRAVALQHFPAELGHGRPSARLAAGQSDHNR
jgi:hypothetical protein